MQRTAEKGEDTIKWKIIRVSAPFRMVKGHAIAYILSPSYPHTEKERKSSEEHKPHESIQVIVFFFFVILDGNPHSERGCKQLLC